jgi:hypothetical protein
MPQVIYAGKAHDKMSLDLGGEKLEVVMIDEC